MNRDENNRLQGFIKHWLQNRQSPIILKTKHESFLIQPASIVKLVSYWKIEERFNIRKENRRKPAHQ